MHPPPANPGAGSSLARPALRNFRLVRTGVDMEALRAELARNEDCWLFDTRRQQSLSVHAKTQAIQLRQVDPSAVTDGVAVRDCGAVIDGVLADEFPETLRWLHETAAALEGELARAMYVRLAAGGIVARHIDTGDYYARRGRFHLCVWSHGSFMMAGGESITAREGDLLWFDNKEPHESRYDAPLGGRRLLRPDDVGARDAWRTHLIFDVLGDAISQGLRATPGHGGMEEDRHG